MTALRPPAVSLASIHVSMPEALSRTLDAVDAAFETERRDLSE